MDEASREVFLRRKEAEMGESRQRAALRLLAGIDLEEMLGAGAAGRNRMALRLRRALERERQRGLRLHWSYDLNRHIALKQALDRLSADRPSGDRPCGTPPTARTPENCAADAKTPGDRRRGALRAMAR